MILLGQKHDSWGRTPSLVGMALISTSHVSYMWRACGNVHVHDHITWIDLSLPWSSSLEVLRTNGKLELG